MLIGDKGQSGGRRWEVSGFALGAFSDSPKVSRWVLHFVLETFCSRRSSGHPRARRWVEIFAPRPFFSSPKVSRWVLHFCPRGIFGVVPGSVARQVVRFPESGLFTSPKVSRWEVSRFALGPFLDSPKVSRWGGGRITGFRIFDQPSGQSLGGGRICPRAIFDQSQGQSLGYAICPWDILHKVIPLSFIRNSPCSTNGYSHLIILTSYLS